MELKGCGLVASQRAIRFNRVEVRGELLSLMPT